MLVIGGQLILGQIGLQQDQRLGGTELVVDVQLQHHPLAIPVLLGIGIQRHLGFALQQDQRLVGVALGEQQVSLQQLQLGLLLGALALLLQLLEQGRGRLGLTERQIAASRHHLPGEGFGRFGRIHLRQIPLGILGQIREGRRHAGLSG